MSSTLPDIIEARRHIRRAFDELPIFKRSREAALYNFCAVLEVHSSLAKADPAAIFQVGRDVVEATTQAVPAIFDRCSNGSASDLAIHRTTYEEAYELFFFARDLEQIIYCFDLADRDQYVVRVDPSSGAIIFSYVERHEDAAESLIRSRELSSRIVAATSLHIQELAPIALAAKAELEKTILFTGIDSISFGMTAPLKTIAAQWATALSNAEHWYFPDSVAIGPYKIGDIRAFWGAVQTLANLHDGAQLLVSEVTHTNWPIGSAVHLRSTSEWSTLIAEISTLPAEAASELLSWYTFDKKVSEPTPMIQPFLEVSAGYLALPSISVTTSAKERNLLKLLNRHPKLRQFGERLNRSKEELALSDLDQMFPTQSFATEKTVIIEGVTDADLVVYERVSGMVMVIQHKWLIAPDTLKESSSNDEELEKGVLQAVESRDAFRTNPELLRRALSLSVSEPLGPVEAVVICRGAEPTGFMSRTDVPVTAEDAFNAICQKQPSLQSLWESLNTRLDRVEASARFRDASRSFDIAGYTFAVPVLTKT